MTARRHVTSLLHRSRSQQWLRKGHLAFDHCLVQQLAQGLIHPQDVGEAMVTLQKLKPQLLLLIFNLEAIIMLRSPTFEMLDCGLLYYL